MTQISADDKEGIFIDRTFLVSALGETECFQQDSATPAGAGVRSHAKFGAVALDSGFRRNDRWEPRT